MDKLLSKSQKEAIINIFVNDIILPQIKSIRNKLASEYDVVNGCFKNYTGLCNEASKEFCDTLNEYFKANGELTKDLQASVESIHGEQRHTPRIESKNWPAQHTWCIVKVAKMKIYVDITSQQFQDIYDDIPDYYVSIIKPKWFYSDKDNIAWRAFFGIPRWFNEHIKIQHKLGDRVIKEGIIEYIQYEIWGKISDKIYKINHK